MNAILSYFFAVIHCRGINSDGKGLLLSEWLYSCVWIMNKIIVEHCRHRKGKGTKKQQILVSHACA